MLYVSFISAYAPSAPYSAIVEKRLMELPEDSFQCWMDVFEHIFANPEVWGCSGHMLYVAGRCNSLIYPYRNIKTWYNKFL